MTKKTAFYHVGFAVPDIEASMDLLSRAVDVTWNTPQSASLGPWAYRIVFTTEPPFIELIQGPAGSPWDTESSGPRFDHLGWWAASLDASADDWSGRCGLDMDYDGRTEGRSFAYFTAVALGTRLELVEADRMGAFLSAWSPGTDPTAMDILDRD
ncbi:VOC family protein [Millisia brevis]|uniref:VOC family protein n=1 Tax=Millisia brevis TaxID=264148 RepID=UPI0008362821|nr:VOC family protein [Millisia brevis]